MRRVYICGGTSLYFVVALVVVVVVGGYGCGCECAWCCHPPSRRAASPTDKTETHKKHRWNRSVVIAVGASLLCMLAQMLLIRDEALRFLVGVERVVILAIVVLLLMPPYGDAAPPLPLSPLSSCLLLSLFR